MCRCHYGALSVRLAAVVTSKRPSYLRANLTAIVLATMCPAPWRINRAGFYYNGDDSYEQPPW